MREWAAQEQGKSVADRTTFINSTPELEGIYNSAVGELEKGNSFLTFIPGTYTYVVSFVEKFTYNQKSKCPTDDVDPPFYTTESGYGTPAQSTIDFTTQTISITISIPVFIGIAAKKELVCYDVDGIRHTFAPAEIVGHELAHQVLSLLYGNGKRVTTTSETSCEDYAPLRNSIERKVEGILNSWRVSRGIPANPEGIPVGLTR